MVLTHFHTLPSITCSFKPKKPPSSTARPHTIPARDRVIDFGKYKGKMLGAIPSIYLKWVSKNLRAGDYEHWAKLADQVVEDPVYKDRLEWEFADSVLNGDNGCREDSAVSQLVEISERFGWDNEDKDGWRRVNFQLLGTSKGARIPRKINNGDGGEINKGLRVEKGEEDKVLTESEWRRKQRRERAKLKSKMDMKEDMLGILRNGDGRIGNEVKNDWTVEINNNINCPFPGREGLSKKVRHGKRFL